MSPAYELRFCNCFLKDFSIESVLLKKAKAQQASFFSGLVEAIVENIHD